MPVLFLFRDLRLVLAAQVVADIILLVLVWRGVRRLNIGALSVHQNTVKNLLAIGWPFLFSGDLFRRPDDRAPAFLGGPRVQEPPS